MYSHEFTLMLDFLKKHSELLILSLLMFSALRLRADSAAFLGHPKELEPPVVLAANLLGISASGEFTREVPCKKCHGKV